MDINCFSKYLAAIRNSMSDPVVKLVCQFICLCSFFDFAKLLPLDLDVCSELLCDVLEVRNDKLSIVTDM